MAPIQHNYEVGTLKRRPQNANFAADANPTPTQRIQIKYGFKCTAHLGLRLQTADSRTPIENRKRKKKKASLGPGARFSKEPIINGPVKLLLFTYKIEVSIVLHLM